MNKMIKEFAVEDERVLKFPNVLRTPHLVVQLYEIVKDVAFAIPLVAIESQMDGAPAYSITIDASNVTLRLHHSTRQGRLQFCLVVLAAV